MFASRKNSSRKSPFNSRSFRVERLEDRQMMAADIGAFIQNGTLNLVESAGEPGGRNAVAVYQVAPGTMRVEGVQADGGGTSFINGHTYQDFSGVSSLNINLAGGNDNVYVGRDNAGKTNLNDVFINVDGSKGPNNSNFDYDHVTVSNLHTTGQLRIQTGPGNDMINMGNLQIGDNDLDSITIKSGAGSDTVNIGNNVSTTGNFSLQTADSTSKATDSDNVWMRNVTANNGLGVTTGAGKDTLDIAGVFANGDILIDTGAGDDTVTLNSVQATDDFFTKLGDGNDTLNVTFLRANKLTLDGGAGTNDRLTTGIDGTVNQLGEFGWEYINGHQTFHPHAATLPKKK